MNIDQRPRVTPSVATHRTLERFVVYALAMAAIVLGALVLAPGLAKADGKGLEIDVVGDTAAMGEHPDGPVLVGDLLAPGATTSGQLVVRSDQSGALRIRARGVRSDDNGCVEPEAAFGDATCGDGQGEMVDAVLLSVSEGGTVLWQGTAAALQTDGLDALILAAGVERTLDWQATVLPSTDNEIQSDSLAFELELVLDGADVAGLVVQRVGGLGALPATGSPVDLLLPVGLGLVLAGLAALRLRLRPSTVARG